MKENERKFSCHHVKKTYNGRMGLKDSAGVSNTRVNTGKTGKGKLQLSERVRKLVEAQWKRRVEDTIGFKNYEELRSFVNQELNRSVV